MDLKVRRQKILNFIYEHFDELDFDEGKYSREFGLDQLIKKFKNYNELIQFQRSVVNEFTEENLFSIEFLIQLLPLLQIMNQKDTILWKIKGFLFAPENQIVLIYQ